MTVEHTDSFTDAVRAEDGPGDRRRPADAPADVIETAPTLDDLPEPVRATASMIVHM